MFEGVLEAIFVAPRLRAPTERVGEVRAREMQDKAKSGSRAERDQARAFFSGTVEVVPGPQGRVALPAHLREFAGLHDEVVITGQFDHIEIWDAERWRQRKQAGEQGLAAGGDE